MTKIITMLDELSRDTIESTIIKSSYYYDYYEDLTDEALYQADKLEKLLKSNKGFKPSPLTVINTNTEEGGSYVDLYDSSKALLPMTDELIYRVERLDYVARNLLNVDQGYQTELILNNVGFVKMKDSTYYSVTGF